MQQNLLFTIFAQTNLIKPMKKLLSTGILLYLIFLVGACNQNPTNADDNPDVFFSQPRFKGDFFKTFSLLEADTIIAHIRSEIPRKWQGFACQGGFYNLQNLDVATDSMQFRYLDAISKAFPADSTLAFADMTRGDLFIQLAKYDTALVCLKRAYALSVRCNNPILVASVDKELGLLAIRQGNYPEATKCYLRSYAFFSTLDTTADRGRIYDILIRLGHVYKKSQNLSEAHKWYLKLWDYAMTGPNSRRYYYAANAALYLADSYVEHEQWDSAQIMLDTLTFFHKTYNNFHREDWRTVLQARVLRGKGDCTAALPLFVLAKNLVKDTTDRARMPTYNKALADGYACAGRLDSAIYWYKAALVTPDSIFRVKILEAMSKAYILRGNYQQAYAYEQQSNDLRNRIFTSQKEQELGRLHAQSELDKQERLLEAEKSQIRLNRMLMLTGLCILALVLTIVLFRFYRKKKALIIAEQTQELLRQEKQLVETQSAWHQQALVQAEQQIVEKESALEASNKLLEVKNMLIESLEMRLTKDHQTIDSMQAVQLANLKILTPEDWHTFRKLFTQRFPMFFINLSSRFPKLSPAETRLFLLIKLGFDTLEISDILGISATSVYVSRSRLRKRLDLREEDDLEQFIKGF